MRERIVWLLVVVLAVVAAVTTTVLVVRDDEPTPTPTSRNEPAPEAITERVTVVCGASASEQECTSQGDRVVQDVCSFPRVRAVELTQSSPSAPAPVTRTVMCNATGR